MGVVDLSRLAPQLPAGAYTTYRVVAPLKTHFRAATCEEAACPQMAHGWRSIVDESTNLGQMQAHFIRRESGRSFKQDRQPDGLTVFTFAAGQRCFQQHRLRIEERPEIFLRQGGDWRGNPLGVPRYRHTRPEHWQEDFALHQDKLAERQARG